MKDNQDAHGHSIYDCFRGLGGYEIVERDDGFFGITRGPHFYLAEYRRWPRPEKQALRYAIGKVLDIGCGGGRVALHLQNKGFDVLGIDISPLAIRTRRLRGLKKARIISITQLSSRLGLFDTLIMFGNNFGLVGGSKRAKWLLRRFHRMTNEKARILAETRDPYQTEEQVHLQYHTLNRKRGRMPGQLRVRVRYKKYVTPWFDWLLVSKDEMAAILENTGWFIRRFIDSDGPGYIAVIEKGKAE